ncbi:MAG: hypothetical protein COU40_01880 [Candidatus Moranbacteria bacterium CG10_big_fil_rev_8_21_14_0_10_35_21]|nr:MAG: hypothetical protein COU40_01880 [Candidatus Moranbacteria bacterium CG10_big_fil_rev_8_21_14_0_10_35_21]
MKKFNLLKKIVYKNIRYIFVFVFLLVTFLINRSLINVVAIPKTCVGENCPQIIENSSLSDKVPMYFVNDIFKSNQNEYYRLVFQEKSSMNTKIKIKISTPTDETQEIGTVELKKSAKYNFHEFLFDSNGEYNDLVFKKENKADGADVSIIGAQLSKLNISSEKEFSSFIPTIKGDIDVTIIDQQQTENSYQFTQLSDQKITFGQVFKATTDYITGITLDMDVVAQKNRKNKDKYRLELREATFSGEVPEVQGSLSHISFSISDLEKYRQSDGKFKFPIFSKVEKGKHYFIGINNIHADVDKSNYLKIKGTLDFDKYTDGIATTVTNKQAYTVDGHLYFIIQGSKFSEYNDTKILTGEIIEDLGGKNGLFNYQPLKNGYALDDLYSYTDDISFDNAKSIVFGIADPNKPSNFIYKFETIFPSKKIMISGQQPDANWNQVKMSYSYDGLKWKEIPSIVKTDVLSPKYKTGDFNYTIAETIPKKEIYIKIEPKINDVVPEKKIMISVQQSDANWNQVKMSYSYDGLKWKEVTREAGELGFKEIHIKIEPKINDVVPEKGYGLVNFKVEAELKMN